MKTIALGMLDIALPNSWHLAFQVDFLDMEEAW